MLSECLIDISARAAVGRRPVEAGPRRHAGQHQVIKRNVNRDNLAAGHNKYPIIRQSVFNEHCKILDPGFWEDHSLYETCILLSQEGMRTNISFADTFIAGAFDQLMQKCNKNQNSLVWK
ncbi:hypothetical protein OPV22_033045 [Ensete ventricosum]|uniref:Uncharacterized protein n=1 Tax=Ensete ventricosum TaxID=4639 RepID=A0AAV8PLU8_ENSVE|nr:hypothetical protein OPV22_033045 [Ensete ventricosum]